MFVKDQARLCVHHRPLPLCPLLPITRRLAALPFLPRSPSPATVPPDRRDHRATPPFRPPQKNLLPTRIPLHTAEDPTRAIGPPPAPNIARFPAIIPLLLQAHVIVESIPAIILLLPPVHVIVEWIPAIIPLLLQAHVIVEWIPAIILLLLQAHVIVEWIPAIIPLLPPAHVIVEWIPAIIRPTRRVRRGAGRRERGRIPAGRLVGRAPAGTARRACTGAWRACGRRTARWCRRRRRARRRAVGAAARREA